MENNLIVVKQIPIIEDQLRRVKASIDERVAQVLALACTEATYKDVKKARAELNKEFQDLEARRREVKKAILAPYEAFEKLYKECAADAFTKADAELKVKITSVENGIKGAKRDEIVAFYNEYRASLNIPEDIAPFERCGINITMSDSLRKLQGQASLFLQNVSNDLRMIETLEHKDEILVEYRKSLSAPEAALIVDRRHKEMEEAARRRHEIRAGGSGGRAGQNRRSPERSAARARFRSYRAARPRRGPCREDLSGVVPRPQQHRQAESSQRISRKWRLRI